MMTQNLACLIGELDDMGVSEVEGRMSKAEGGETRLRMTVVCAWCKSVKSQGDPDGDVSHTICRECRAVFFPKSTIPVEVV